MAGRSTREVAAEAVAPIARKLVLLSETVESLSVRLRETEEMLREVGEHVGELETKPAPASPAPAAPETHFVNLINTLKNPMMDARGVDGEDGTVFHGFTRVAHGETHAFDADNPSIRIAALGGNLAPADAEAEAWLAGLRR